MKNDLIDEDAISQLYQKQNPWQAFSTMLFSNSNNIHRSKKNIERNGVIQN